GVEAGTDAKDVVNKGQLDALAGQQTATDNAAVKYDDATTKDKVTLGGGATGTTLSNVKAGDISATSMDAVNGGQLFTTNQNVEQNSQNITTNSNNITGNTTDITTLKGGFSLQTNGQNGAAIKAGDTVDIGVAEPTDTNLTATKTGNNVAFALSKDLQLNSVTTGNTVINNAGVTTDKVTVGNVVIDKTTNKISGVEAGTDAKDVVNKGQLDNLADGAVQYERDPITNAINYNKVILAGTPAVIGKDANGNNIVISGGTSLGNVANGVKASDAVNKGQLDSAQNALTNAGLSFAGDSGTNVKRKLGETLNITGGAKAPLTTGNIGVVANGKDGLLVQLAKDIDLGADGSVKTGNTVTNNEGVKVDDGKGNSTTITTAGTNVVDDEGNSADYTATGSELADKDGNTNISTAKGNTITNGDNVTTITGKGTNVVDNATGNSADYGANGFIATDAAGNTTIFNQGGVSFIDGTGMQTGPSISVGGLNAGGTVITNVGDAVKATDAVNKGQLDKVTAEANGKTDALGNSTANNLGGGAKYDPDTGKVSAPSYSLDNGSVNVNNVGDALTNLDDRITSNTDNIADLAAGKAGLVQQQTPTDSITVGAATGGTSVDFTGKDGDRLLTGVANGTVAAGSNDVVTGDQLNNTADSIVSVIGGNAKNEGGVITTTDIGGTGKNTIDDAIASLKDGENASNDNIQANTDRLDAGLSFGADNGADINKPIGDGTALKFEGSDNITTTTTGSGIKFDLSGNISVDSVTTGNTTVNNNGVSIKDGPSMTVDGIYAGNKTITGVADGIEVNDAVNLGQLNALDQRVSNSVNELGYKIGEVEDGANAGISAAMAMSSLPQAYIPGKSMIGGGVATYNGQSAVAVGISRVSDNGRWVIKANGTADTQGNAGGAIGAGFHF
ncbi:YadA-like family protein, partial [Psychrobacter sp. Ps4]|uniref:YadA-like family protein n=1 Tax=Psychrobacter sp. Ps4 TaxID=2790958 RepID=UPI001EE10FFD